MTRRIVTGIDIGTYQIKMVVVEEVIDKNVKSLRVIGTGSSTTRGMHKGYVINKDEVTESIKIAKQAAEQAARVSLKNGFLAIGSVSINETHATGEAIISRADQEVTELDLDIALKTAKDAAAASFLNRYVLHEIPTEYRVDGIKTYGNPIGMKGTRIEADFLFITCLSSQIESLIEVTENSDIEIIDQMASPLAGSYVALSNDQKMRGCLLTNIGSETVSIVAYDEGVPLSIKVFSSGSSQITDDIALSFKISLDDAEKVKLGRLGGVMYTKKKIDTLVSSRLTKIFQIIEKHIKNIGHKGPLPAGIIISGGGGTTSAVEVARKTLSLPARIAELSSVDKSPTRTNKLRNGTWAVAYGIALWGLTGDTETRNNTFIKNITTAVRKFIHQFTP